MLGLSMSFRTSASSEGFSNRRRRKLETRVTRVTEQHIDTLVGSADRSGASRGTKSRASRPLAHALCLCRHVGRRPGAGPLRRPRPAPLRTNGDSAHGRLECAARARRTRERERERGLALRARFSRGRTPQKQSAGRSPSADRSRPRAARGAPAGPKSLWTVSRTPPSRRTLAAKCERGCVLASQLSQRRLRRELASRARESFRGRPEFVGEPRQPLRVVFDSSRTPQERERRDLSGRQCLSVLAARAFSPRHFLSVPEMLLRWQNLPSCFPRQVSLHRVPVLGRALATTLLGRRPSVEKLDLSSARHARADRCRRRARDIGRRQRTDHEQRQQGNN